MGGGYNNNVIYRKLGEVAELYAGATPKTSNSDYWTNGTIPWMSSGEVNLGQVFYTEKKITQLGYDSCSTKIVPKNTVVVALAGQGKTRGTVAITRIELCTNQSLCSIIPNEYVKSDFLYHFLKGQYQTLRNISSGNGTRGGLSLKILKDFEIPVPPLETQKRIVSILDKFETLANSLSDGLPAEIEARKKQYEYYRDKLLDFKDVGGGYCLLRKLVQWLPLGEIATITRGGNFQKKDFTSNGIPCIHYGQIYTKYGLYANETFTFISEEVAKKSKKATTNDIIMAVTSENVEDVCKCVAWLGKEDVAVSGHTAIIHHNQNAKYLAYYFHTQMFFVQQEKYAHGTKVIEVTPSKLADIIIPLPPLAIQGWIAEILDKFHSLATDISEGIPAEIEARKKQYEYYRDKLLAFKKIENVV